jgi:CheY-like chemotaxis protein
VTEAGEQGLAALDDGPQPDVLVLDQVMPGLHGTQVADRLRERGFTRPIVLCSANLAATPKRTLSRLELLTVNKIDATAVVRLAHAAVVRLAHTAVLEHRLTEHRSSGAGRSGRSRRAPARRAARAARRARTASGRRPARRP